MAALMPQNLNVSAVNPLPITHEGDEQLYGGIGFIGLLKMDSSIWAQWGVCLPGDRRWLMELQKQETYDEQLFRRWKRKFGNMFHD
jgi:hypothetical protein